VEDKRAPLMSGSLANLFMFKSITQFYPSVTSFSLTET